MSVHVRFLSRFPLFKDVPECARAVLAEAMILRPVARREVVLHKGQGGEGMGFLLDGRLQGTDFTLDGREVGLYFVSSGECFGELAVVDGLPSPEYVVALVKSEILFLPEDSARQALLSTPSLAQAVLVRLAARVRVGTEQRALLAVASPMQRLCSQLLALVDPSSGAIPYAPTQQELAIMINTTRETVTRNFQVLQSRGIVSRQGDVMAVASPDRLRLLAAGKDVD